MFSLSSGSHLGACTTVVLDWSPLKHFRTEDLQMVGVEELSLERIYISRRDSGKWHFHIRCFIHFHHYFWFSWGDLYDISCSWSLLSKTVHLQRHFGSYFRFIDKVDRIVFQHIVLWIWNSWTAHCSVPQLSKFILQFSSEIRAI